jgi:hypothetical protein
LTSTGSLHDDSCAPRVKEERFPCTHQLPGLSVLPTSISKQALVETIEHLTGEGTTLGQLAGSQELISGLKDHLEGLLSIQQLLSLLNGQSLSTVLNAPRPVRRRRWLGQLR